MHPDEHYTELRNKLKAEQEKLRKRRFVHDYTRRDWNIGSGMIRGDRFCLACWKVDTRTTCCGQDTKYLGPKARPPRKTASKKKWKEFLQLYAPTILKDKNWWKNRQK